MAVKQHLVAPPFRGMDFSVDGALLAKDVLQLATNARFDKGAIRRRDAVTRIVGPAYNMPALTVPVNAAAGVDYVQFPLAAGLQTSASFTLGFWFKWSGTSTTGSDIVIQGRDSGGTESGFRVDCVYYSSAARLIRGVFHTVAGDLTVDTASLAASTWYWITVGADDQGANLYVAVWVNGLLSDSATNASNLTATRDHVRIVGRIGASGPSYQFRSLKIDTVGPMTGGYNPTYTQLAASVFSRFQDVGDDMGGTAQQYVFKDTTSTASDSIGANHGTYNGAAATSWAATPTIAMQQALYSPKAFERPDTVVEDGMTCIWMTAPEGIYREDDTLSPRLLSAGMGQTDHADYAGVQYFAPGDGKLYQYHADSLAIDPTPASLVTGAKVIDWIGPLLDQDAFDIVNVTSILDYNTGLVVLDLGFYQYKLTAYSAYTGESSVSFYDSASIQSTTGKSIEITFGALNPSNAFKPHVTHIEIWRTKVAATAAAVTAPYYLVARVAVDAIWASAATISYIDSTNDGNLGATTLPTIGTVLPTLNRIEIHRDRMWGSSGTDAKLYYSNLGDPTKWDTTAQIIQVGEDSDPITRKISIHDALYVFKRDSIYILRGVTDADFTLSEAFQSTGCSAPWTLIEASGELFWIGAGSVWRMAGTSLVDIGTPVGHFLTSIREADATSVYDEAGGRVMFGVYYNARWDHFGTSTQNSLRADVTLTYDLAIGGWSMDTVPACGFARVPAGTTSYADAILAIVDSTVVTSGSTNAFASSLVRFLDQYADYNASADNAVTPTTHNATSIVKAGAWAGNEAGQYLMATGEDAGASTFTNAGSLRRVISATTSTLTIGATFPYAVTQGTVFCSGAIPLMLETGWLDFGNPGVLKRLQNLVVHWDEMIPNAGTSREHWAYALIYADRLDPWEYEGHTDTYSIFDGTGRYKPRDLFLSTKTAGTQNNSRYASGAVTSISLIEITGSSAVVRTRADVLGRWFKVRLLVPHAPNDFALRSLEFHYSAGGL